MKNYYSVLTIPYEEGRRICKKFRIDDVGRKGHTQRLACKTKDGWLTVAWRLNKADYDVVNGQLVPQNELAEKFYANLCRTEGIPYHIGGDYFEIG